ncbi:MAG: hypothetical protein RLY58_842 [Pseudomonadota bacterium]|jgi:hypothetical protein
MTLLERLTLAVQSIGADIKALNAARPKLKQTTINVTNASSSTFVTLAELAIPVTAGKVYQLEYLLRIQSTSTLIGPAIQLITPAGTLTATTHRSRAADGTGGFFHGAITASADIVADNATQATNTAQPLRIDAVFMPTANGTINLQFRMEAGLLGSGTVQINTGSCVVYSEITP